jgi:predicted nucleic acid-binding protein
MASEKHNRLTAFLDTSVLLAYLSGDEVVSKLFSNEVTSRVKFAVNPIVLQELFLSSEAHSHPELLRSIQEQLEILPLDPPRATKWVTRARELRNRIAHSNDLLILSSAAGCDYLVTDDIDFRALSPSEPKVVTPREFLEQIGGRR